MRPIASHRQRIEACLGGSSEFGVPVALWRHFPVDDQQPDTLAAAHLQFQRRRIWRRIGEPWMRGAGQPKAPESTLSG